MATDFSDYPIEINGERAPYEIHGVSQSYFSVARYYGGCKAFGTRYTYDPTRDVLIRDDVLEGEAKKARAAKKKTKAKAKAKEPKPLLGE